MPSKLKKSLIAISISVALTCPSAFAARFLDTSGNWAETYINILSDKGIIPGELDGKFKPDEPITRAALAAWLVKVLGIENQPVPSKPSFADVKETDWFYKPVEIIRQNNYISGYSDGFRPNQFIQKGEVVTIISRALNKTAPDETQIEDELQKYKDASKVPSWARVGVAETSMAGILLVGPDTQSIGADQLATRADTIALLYKLDEYIARRDENDVLKRTARNRPQGSPYNGAPGTAMRPPNSAPPGYGQPQSNPGQNNRWNQDNNYQGQVAKQGDYFGAQSYSGNGPSGNYYSQGPQYGSSGGPPQYGNANTGAPPLQGGVIVLAAGTKFRAELKNSINSGSTQTGEEIRVTINEPIYANGTEVIPAGSRLTGTASSVSPAHRFKAGAPGKMDIRFTTCETPDGRNFPLSASIDENDQRMSGSSTAGRVGKGLVTTGIGAGSGAVVGTALGAIVGGTSNGNMGQAIGMGAVFGTAIGAGVGGVTALVKKGTELNLAAGTSLPIKLDDQVPIPLPQSGGGYSAYGSAPNYQPPAPRTLPPQASTTPIKNPAAPAKTAKKNKKEKEKEKEKDSEKSRDQENDNQKIDPQKNGKASKESKVSKDTREKKSKISGTDKSVKKSGLIPDVPPVQPVTVHEVAPSAERKTDEKSTEQKDAPASKDAADSKIAPGKASPDLSAAPDTKSAPDANVTQDSKDSPAVDVKQNADVTPASKNSPDAPQGSK